MLVKRLLLRGLVAVPALALYLVGTSIAGPPLPIGDAKLRDTRAPAGDPNISGVWQVRGAGLRIFPRCRW